MGCKLGEYCSICKSVIKCEHFVSFLEATNAYEFPPHDVESLENIVSLMPFCIKFLKKCSEELTKMVNADNTIKLKKVQYSDRRIALMSVWTKEAYSALKSHSRYSELLDEDGFLKPPYSIREYLNDEELEYYTEVQSFKSDWYINIKGENRCNRQTTNKMR